MRSRRLAFFLVGDGVLLTLSLITAVALRFDGAIPSAVARQLPLAIALSLLIKLTVFAADGLYSLNWSHVGLEDMVTVLRSVTLASTVFSLCVSLLIFMRLLGGFPRSVLLIDYVITFCAIGAFRGGQRLHQHLTHPYRTGGRSALIVGAGVAAQQLARSLRYRSGSEYVPAGFVDDDHRKWGTVIHGLRVLGGCERLPTIVEAHRIEAVLIAIPSGPSRLVRRVVSLAREAGVKEIRTVPGLDRILDGQVSFTDLREVQPADLLGRDVVRIDTVALEEWIRGRTVMVTGAGGSIGSELCRQLAGFRPGKFALIDCDETGLFYVEQELQQLGQRTTARVADVRDLVGMREAFRAIRPHVVFHAAAYKHVGLMERHPEQAISVNILGTQVVATVAGEANVEKFVLISTDKAVNPTSVMGATKRVAEQICLVLNEGGTTRYLAVRFGNVLGSRGSVVPLFQGKIRRGEPLTIRGRNMRRYFMTISEAVQLVLQAGVAGQGGEVFVLDMGEPVHIASFARELIRLSGLEPDTDVPIVYADPEPGEKDHEDLLAAEEGTTATRHERIFVARGASSLPPDRVFAHVGALNDLIEQRGYDAMIDTLRALVPTYQPSELWRGRVAVTPREDPGVLVR